MAYILKSYHNNLYAIAVGHFMIHILCPIKQSDGNRQLLLSFQTLDILEHLARPNDYKATCISRAYYI